MCAIWNDPVKSEKLMMKDGEGSKEARRELSNSRAVGLASNRRICDNLRENKMCGADASQ